MAARIFVRIMSGKQGSGRETDQKSEQQFLKPQKIYVVIERKMKLILIVIEHLLWVSYALCILIIYL